VQRCSHFTVCGGPRPNAGASDELPTVWAPRSPVGDTSGFVALRWCSLDTELEPSTWADGEPQQRQRRLPIKWSARVESGTPNAYGCDWMRVWLYIAWSRTPKTWSHREARILLRCPRENDGIQLRRVQARRWLWQVGPTVKRLRTHPAKSLWDGWSTWRVLCGRWAGTGGLAGRPITWTSLLFFYSPFVSFVIFLFAIQFQNWVQICSWDFKFRFLMHKQKHQYKICQFIYLSIGSHME
jgi:hypothetical protein